MLSEGQGALTIAGGAPTFQVSPMGMESPDNRRKADDSYYTGLSGTVVVGCAQRLPGSRDAPNARRAP